MWKWGFNIGRHEFLIYWSRLSGAKGIRLISYPRDWFNDDPTWWD